MGVDNVLGHEGTPNQQIVDEVGHLAAMLHQRSVSLAVVSNSTWKLTDNTPLQQHLERRWNVPFSWYTGGENVAYKQRAECLAKIRSDHGVEPNECLYLGNSQADMQCAINGGVLFLNGLWFANNTPYGLLFNTPREVGRFIDLFCLQDEDWFWKLDHNGIYACSLAPYGTFKAESREYSENFIETVKQRLGTADDVKFWGMLLCTRLYFSGLYRDIDYITHYPGHLRGSFPPVLQAPLDAFAKCFRGKFLPDLIIRHTDAVESKRNRSTTNHLNQLNTICLNPLPEKKPGEAYRHNPLKTKKNDPPRTILVLDDMLTAGFSMEAARYYLEQAGATPVLVGLLKATNNDYLALPRPAPTNNPYEVNTFPNCPQPVRYSYNRYIVDHDAPRKLTRILDEYHDWDWPT